MPKFESERLSDCVDSAEVVDSLMRGPLTDIVDPKFGKVLD